VTSSDTPSEQYARRFQAAQAYRDGVWKILLKSRLQEWVGRDKDVLDLGCGWGEFIRNVQATKTYPMDLNSDAAETVGEDVSFLLQDCPQVWDLEDGSLDVIFSSNFIEHLPDKDAVDATLAQARRCLREDGKIIFLGPNIRYVGGAYWDFWDHYLPITDKSLMEWLSLRGFKFSKVLRRFLPYTMFDGREVPLFMVGLYSALPVFWPLLGKQFLIVARPM